MTTWPFPEKPFEAPTKETGCHEMLKASKKALENAVWQFDKLQMFRILMDLCSSAHEV